MSPKSPFKRICGMPNKTTRQATRPKRLSGPVRSNSTYVVPRPSPTHRGRAQHHIGCRQLVFTRQLPSPIPTATLPLLLLGRSHPMKSPQPYRYADRASLSPLPRSPVRPLHGVRQPHSLALLVRCSVVGLWRFFPLPTAVQFIDLPCFFIIDYG
jgi:hypothetical protein